MILNQICTHCQIFWLKNAKTFSKSDFQKQSINLQFSKKFIPKQYVTLLYDNHIHQNIRTSSLFNLP